MLVISKVGAARVSEMGVGGFTQCWGYHYSQELVPTISGNERAFDAVRIRYISLSKHFR